METEQAAALVEELSGRNDLTGDEKRLLHEARIVLGLATPVTTVKAVANADMDLSTIRELDPLTLTGQQKQALGGNGGRIAGAKPRPRAALTPDGRDPRTLTGAEKKALGFAHKQRAARELPPPPPVVEGALTPVEVHELGMLRAGQSLDHAASLAVRALEGALPNGLPEPALPALQRFELALRRHC